jgi:uncharacterized protein YraI
MALFRLIAGFGMLCLLAACGTAASRPTTPMITPTAERESPVTTIATPEATATIRPSATVAAEFTAARRPSPTTARLIVTPTATPVPTATAVPSATAVPAPAEAAQVACGRAVVVEVEALSLRAEPDLQAERLAAVPRGVAVDLRCLDAVAADERNWLAVQHNGIAGWMSDRYLAIQPAGVVPTAVPAGTQRYVFPLRAARYDYGAYHHDYPATDIFCPIGSEYLAVTDGVVDFVNREDRWDPANDDPALRGGIMIAIIGDDGVRYYASHLSAIAAGLAVGDRVEAGQVLGLSGASGNARSTPPHIHFGISRPTTPDDWRTRRGELSPYPYLRAWERGEQVTPDLSRIGR